MTKNRHNTTTWIAIAIIFIVGILTAVGYTEIQNGNGTTGRRAILNPGGATQFDTGKTPATPGEQPWMVALVESGEQNAHDGQFCGGSLITPDLVLTAAHCIVDFDSAQEIDVVIGRHVLSSSTGERIPVESVYVHEGYDNYEDGEDNDITVMKLERPSRIGTPIQVINRSNAEVDDPGTIARATGWGILTDTGETSPDTLHGVDIPVVSQATCEGAYGSDLTPDAICAGAPEGGRDTCSGDSGGPLVAFDSTGTPIQIGVVSWGDECGAPGVFGVYARLTEYEDWIQSIRDGQLAETDLSEYVYEDEEEWDDDWGWDWNDSDSDEDWSEWDDDEWYEDGEYYDEYEDDWGYADEEYDDDGWFFFGDEDDFDEDWE